MHLMPQMHTMNHGESTCRTLSTPNLAVMLEQPQGREVVAAPLLVITTDPQLQREPPTMCHKISADKVAQLSSKGDIKEDQLNARETLSNQHTQLWMRGITQQLFVSSATETEAFYHHILTITLLLHCPESWKLGPCVPFLGTALSAL